MIAGLGLFNYIDDPAACESMDRKMAVNRVTERKQTQQREAKAEQVAETLAELQANVLLVVDAELGEIAAGEPYAESTKRQYSYYLRKYRDWCANQGLPSDVVTPESVSAFMIAVAGSGDKKFYRTAIGARSALNEYWLATREPNPCDDVLVSATAAWLKARQTEVNKQAANH